MRSLIILLFLIGVIMIVYDIQKDNCPPPRIEYRYIPKTFEEEQLEQLPILGIYGDLFTKATPWTESVGYPGIFKNKKEAF